MQIFLAPFELESQAGFHQLLMFVICKTNKRRKAVPQQQSFLANSQFFGMWPEETCFLTKGRRLMGRQIQAAINK